MIFNSFKLDESRPSDWPHINSRSGPGCHQYYSESTGRISSFNFDRTAPNDSRYQRGLNYKMCVRPVGITHCEVSVNTVSPQKRRFKDPFKHPL